jgi:hypothetical protein
MNKQLQCAYVRGMKGYCIHASSAPSGGAMCIQTDDIFSFLRDLGSLFVFLIHLLINYRCFGKIKLIV